MQFFNRWEAGQNGTPEERCHIIQSHTRYTKHDICKYLLFLPLGGSLIHV